MTRSFEEAASLPSLACAAYPYRSRSYYRRATSAGGGEPRRPEL